MNPNSFFKTANPLHQLNPTLMKTKQQGIALIFVMLILVVVSILGIGGAQLAMMGEKGARNERDIQISRQAAEAALVDAEFDMNSTAAGSRAVDFTSAMNFIDGCGTSGVSKGLCAQTEVGKPIWLTVNFMNDSGNAPTTYIGEKTGRIMNYGNGIQPALRPRYIVEYLTVYPTGSNKSAKAKAAPVYRITTMGFGPRSDIQTVLQMVYRKD